MVPIAIGSEEQFDAEAFRDYILRTTKRHKAENRAMAFAFIVYDFENNTIQEIIENKKYWTSLDKISGQFLSVFYINSQDSYFEKRQKQIYEEDLRQLYKSEKYQPRFYLMNPIKTTLSPLDRSVGFLKAEFKIDTYPETPFILFFQTNGDEITDYFIVELKQEKLEDAFLELKKQIQNAVNALGKVTPENRHNHQEIFNLIKNEVKGAIVLNVIKTKVIEKIGIGTIISFIKFIATAF